VTDRLRPLRGFADRLEVAVDDVAEVQRLAGGRREDEVLILVLRAGLELHGRLRAPVLDEGARDARREGNGAAVPVRLRLREV